MTWVLRRSLCLCVKNLFQVLGVLILVLTQTGFRHPPELLRLLDLKILTRSLLGEICLLPKSLNISDPARLMHLQLLRLLVDQQSLASRWVRTLLFDYTERVQTLVYGGRLQVFVLVSDHAASLTLLFLLILPATFDPV